MTVSDYQTTLVVPSSVVATIVSLGSTRLSGSVVVEDATATDASPPMLNGESSPQAFSVGLTSGQAASITLAPVSVGPFVAGAAGTVEVSPGPLTITAMLPVLGESSIPCTLTTNPAPVVTSTTIVPGPLSVITASLPPATVGASYDTQLDAVGGKPPYLWALAPGSVLPPGLHLDATQGSLSGTPTVAGTSTVELRVTDSSDPAETAVSRPLVISIGPPLVPRDAFGWGQIGQVGNVASTDSSTPAPLRGLPAGVVPTALASGVEDTFVLSSAGAVYGWGYNSDGELGNGTTTESGIPVQASMPVGTTVTAIAAGGFHVIVLTAAGTVYSWGQGADGQLGDGTTSASAVPVAVQLPPGVTATAIAATGDGGLALSSTGQVYAWGAGGYGQLGNGSTTDSTVPVVVSMPSAVRFVAISGGGAHSLALSATGRVYAWGAGGYGQLGNGSTTDSNVPVEVGLLTSMRIVAIAAGGAHSLALSATGQVYAFGENGDGQLGTGTLSTDVPIPVRLPAGVLATGIAAGAAHSLVLTSTGALYAFGDDRSGQVGNGTVQSRVPFPTLVDLPGGTRAITVASGPDAEGSLALLTTTPLPTTTVGLPGAGAVLAGGVWLDAAATSPLGVATVHFVLSGGRLTGPVTIATATPTVDGWLAGWASSDVQNGTYRLQSVATDTSGETASSPAVVVTVRNPRLTTRIILPGRPTEVARGATVVLDASAVGRAAVSSVSFQISGGSIRTPVTIATATLTIDGWIAEWHVRALAAGRYRLESVTTDAAGHVASSPPRRITVGPFGPRGTGTTMANLPGQGGHR